MWCPENTMTNYPYILFNNPQSNYAVREREAAEPTAATSDFGAPKRQHRLRPAHYQRRLAKPPPKPSPSSTHSFLGCAVRKSDLPGTSLNVRARCTSSPNCITPAIW
jgi:hypothetical protein